MAVEISIWYRLKLSGYGVEEAREGYGGCLWPRTRSRDSPDETLRLEKGFGDEERCGGSSSGEFPAKDVSRWSRFAMSGLCDACSVGVGIVTRRRLRDRFRHVTVKSVWAGFIYI